MRLTKRIFSSVLVLLMVLSVVSTGFTAFAVESDEVFFEEIIESPIDRPVKNACLIDYIRRLTAPRALAIFYIPLVFPLNPF